MQRQSTRNTVLGVWLATLLLAGCAPSSSNQNATPLPSQSIIEYLGATATATVVAEGTLENLLPTPTPFLYTVVANDTFYGIAAKLNINLDALRAANPGIDPGLLSPGMQLLIPTGQVALTTSIPTITPVQTNASEPDCYVSAAGELRCFVLVINDGDLPLENVTGVVQLFSADGALLANLEAVPPLDIVSAGSNMPLVAYMEQPPEGWVTAGAQILTAFRLQQGDQHYLPASAEVNISIADSGTAARVQGSVGVQGNAQSIWVLGVAYDADGHVVGVRKWESTGQTGFDFWIYSLGPDIASVDLAVQAQP